MMIDSDRERGLKQHRVPLVVLSALILLYANGCRNSAAEAPGGSDSTAVQAAVSSTLALPHLSPVELASGEKLRVVATTSILGDVVSAVGGDAIELTILIEAGQDPHGYEPTARDLAAVSEAHVIFVNGWNLEHSLLDDVRNVAGSVPIIPVSAEIAPRTSDGGIDPHVWLNPHHVMKWVTNLSTVLTALDPADEPTYQQNAAAYQVQVENLVDYVEKKVATVPLDRRTMVTNHDSLGYFADAYGFEVIGTVIPGADTLAESSAQGLSQLADQIAVAGICVVYTETTANERLAQAVAAESDTCPSVRMIALYTGALGLAGSGAEDYLSMMRLNIDAIVAGQNDE